MQPWNCKGTPASIFFPIGTKRGAPPKNGERKGKTTEELEREVIAKYCSGCSTTGECLEQHLRIVSSLLEVGVAGGRTSNEIKEIIRTRGVVA